jgi:hypothetical protein
MTRAHRALSVNDVLGVDLKASKANVSALNDVENQDVVYFRGIEITRWKPFCYLSRGPERVDCYNCESKGKKPCAPRWRR